MRRFIVASIALCSWALALCCFSLAGRLVCTKARVININDSALLVSRNLPGFISQRMDAPRLRVFRSEVAEIVKPNTGDLEKAIALRKWCRSQQTGDWEGNDNSSEDPGQLLARQRHGISRSCRRFAYVFAGALLASGLDSRIVSLTSGIYDSSNSHTLVEVWIQEINKWVVMDSMYNTALFVDRKPPSLIEVHDAIRADPARVTFERNGSTTEPTPRLDDNYIALFQHLWCAMTNALFDGYRVSLFGSKRIEFTHFVHPGGEP